MSPTSCHPLTLTRSLEDFPIGNVPLRVHHENLRINHRGVTIHSHAWIEPGEAAWFDGALFHTLVDDEGQPLAWTGAGPQSAGARVAKQSFLIRYPWDLLRAHERFLQCMSASKIEGDLHPSAVVEGFLHLAPGARILPGVYIEGNVIIGAGCKIGPNCYIRGNTSIGENCIIGQAVEIKNNVILNRSIVAHLSYVGDSILGENVNFGAGTIVSNFRHDGGNHHSMVDGVLVDTGRTKFGTVVGDNVRTGIHTSIYCGRKLWPGTSTRPGEVVERDLMAAPGA